MTGASGGIGREVAVRLAQDGFSVVVNDAGNEVKAAQTVDVVTAVGGRAIAVRFAALGTNLVAGYGSDDAAAQDAAARGAPARRGIRATHRASTRPGKCPGCRRLPRSRRARRRSSNRQLPRTTACGRSDVRRRTQADSHA